MTDDSNGTTLIVGYMVGKRVYLLSQEEAEPIEELEYLRRNGRQVRLQLIFEALELKKKLLPLSEFYDYIDRHNYSKTFNKIPVCIMISNQKDYLYDVNKHLAPLTPGYYLLFQTEKDFEYSLRYSAGKLVIVISPNPGNDFIWNLTKKN